MTIIGIKHPFPYRQWNVVTGIIAINLLAFFFTTLSPRLLQYFAMNPYLTIYQRMYWQPFTYMFLHGTVTHILFNMLILFVFGQYLERALGSIEFLVLYLGVGLLAGIFSLWLYITTGTYMIFLLGASGAIYGTVFVFAVLNPHAMLYLMGLIPISARMLVLLYTALDLLSHLGGGTNTAHMTHLAGFGFAALYCVFRLRLNPLQRLLSN
ncbi:rhomboid family intramembrane serine protease [Spirochaeta africana]|uniref:rhomboid family intramembrane serine protease n=1 Tax=Spirochaeta africana TaxID=46355 RepID=UPI00059EB70D|nr:rhomboid family intramembrane serine protease [Spirochaeta africana]